MDVNLLNHFKFTIFNNNVANNTFNEFNNYTTLSPLKNDTLSFCGRKKIEIPLETLQKLIDEGKNINEIAEILGISTIPVSRELKKHGLKTKDTINREQKQEKVAQITFETLKKLTDEGKNAKEIAKIFSVSDMIIYKKLEELGLKTHNQRKHEITKNITQEEFLKSKSKTKNISECAKLLGISISAYHRLDKKFHIDKQEQIIHKETQNKKYEDFSLDEIKDRLVESLDCDRIYKDEDLSKLIDFIGSRRSLSKGQKTNVVAFLRLIDKIALNTISIIEVMGDESISKLQSWQEETEKLPDQFENAILSLFQNQESELAALCSNKYTPNINNDKNIEEAKQIIDIISKSKSTDETRYRLTYFLKNADADVVEKAEEYSFEKFKKIDDKLAGKYMFYANLLKNFQKGAAIDSIIPVQYWEILDDKDISREDAVDVLIRLDDYYNSNAAKKFSLSALVEKFDKEKDIVKEIITTYINEFYVNNDTPILAVHENGTNKEFVMSSKVKRIILDKYPAASGQLLLKFENAMKKFAVRAKDTGIKYYGNKKYEVKILGDGGNRRLLTKANSNIFDEFIDDH